MNYNNTIQLRMKRKIENSITRLLKLVWLFLKYGLVPLMVELAVTNNWSGFGVQNRWFYFFYFLSIGLTYSDYDKKRSGSAYGISE